MSNLKETEVKIYITDLAAVREKLQALGAELVQERTHEHNTRYDKENSVFAENGYVLRLRSYDGVTLTYKEPSIIERGIKTREELEVGVSDFEVMELILNRFGFEPYMVYEKYRAVFRLNDTLVMLDELPYGDFIEVEGSRGKIEEVLEMLGLEDAERREHSYTRLFDFVKHHLELNFNDLTFENFKDIDVPESAFIPPGSIIIS